MDILVMETTTGAARTAAEQLEAAGHRIHRCHDAQSSAFPCAGLTSTCPIEATPIDLVLTVRPHVRTAASAVEDGVACGLRHRIPVAVAGQSLMNPFERFGAEAAGPDLVAACERIATSGRPDHEQLAIGLVRDALAADGAPTDPASVAVHRVGGRLRVQISVPEAVAARTREIIAVRVIGRLREFDPHADGIDVSVTPSGADA